MPKELLSVRIPPELMSKINDIADETRRDKTSVTVELLMRGLNTMKASPLESDNFVSAEKFEAVIANLAQEVAELKKLELVA